MTPRKDAPDSGQIVGPADVDKLARSMLLLHGVHADDDHTDGEVEGTTGTWARSWSKAPSFGDDRAEAIRQATARDRERYLTSGLVSVDCRFCHVAVGVKKLGPAHTSVQWNAEATRPVRLLRRDPRVRRRSRPREVLPEAGRQHQTRCRRRLSGGDVVGALARRRLALDCQHGKTSGRRPARTRRDRLHAGGRQPSTEYHSSGGADHRRPGR